MNKKLPGVFANKVFSNGNNENVFYGQKETQEEVNHIVSKNDINKKINEIFNSTDYIYKADVIIKLNNENLTKRIVGRNSRYLITMDNELIPIKDIIDIKKK